MRLRPFPLLVGAAVAAMAGHARAAAQDLASADPEQVIDFAAETLIYDHETDVVTASRDVVIVRGGYRLRADQVVYDRRAGKAEARSR